MKFGSALHRCFPYNQSAPCITDVHATYKAAKKLLKLSNAAALSRLLVDKVETWNDEFLDAEEDLVMECAELEELCEEDDEGPGGSYELLRSLVDYHGRQATSAQGGCLECAVARR
jgi:hypothetical protein